MRNPAYIESDQRLPQSSLPSSPGRDTRQNVVLPAFGEFAGKFARFGKFVVHGEQLCIVGAWDFPLTGESFAYVSCMLFIISQLEE